MTDRSFLVGRRAQKLPLSNNLYKLDLSVNLYLNLFIVPPHGILQIIHL